MTVIRSRMTGAFRMEIESALVLALFFGVISPKRMISMVNTAVPAETMLSPKIRIISEVASAEAERLTTLLPIRMAESILL